MNKLILKAAGTTAALMLTLANSAGFVTAQPVPPLEVRVQPRSFNIDSAAPKTVMVLWASEDWARSDRGRFVTPDGRVLGTEEVVVSLSSMNNLGIYNASETFTAGMEIITAAIAGGHYHFDYVRTFYDDIPETPDVSPRVRFTLSNLPSMVEVDPSRVSVSYGTDTTVNLTWTVEVAGGNKVWVESREGNFTDKRGRLLRPPANTFLRQAGARRVTFEETLVVPRSIVDTIASRGETLFHFTREFMVNGLALPGSLELRIEGGLASVTPSEPRQQVAASRTSMVAVTWLARLKPGVDPSGLKISSPGGVFRTPDGMTIRRAGRPLTSTMGSKSVSRRGRSKAVQPPGQVIKMSENVSVPVDVARTVVDRGYSNFLYSRTFTDGFNNVEGTVIFDLTGRIGGGFNIDRVSLYFPDKSLVKVVSPEEKLYALAEVSWTGSGRIIANWEIAEPTSSVGVPIFKTFSRVVRQLNVRKRIVLESPELPTDMSGPYVIRFRIINPDLGERSAVALLYQVNQPTVGAIPIGPGGVLEISILKPLGKVPPVPGAPFAWEPIAGSIAYQLEFFDGASLSSARRVSGQIVPGNLTELALTKLTTATLTPGMNYWWRVVAFGPGGGILGASELTPTSLQ